MGVSGERKTGRSSDAYSGPVPSDGGPDAGDARGTTTRDAGDFDG